MIPPASYRQTMGENMIQFLAKRKKPDLGRRHDQSYHANSEKTGGKNTITVKVVQVFGK